MTLSQCVKEGGDLTDWIAALSSQFQSDGLYFRFGHAESRSPTPHESLFVLTAEFTNA
jgi:hypothetical protein